MPEEIKAQNEKKIDPKIDPKKRQLTLSEYQALQEKEAKKFKLKVPFAVKIVLALPVIIFFLFGLFYIPFLAIKGCSPESQTTDTK